jgi:hypothetical protein
MALRMGFQYQIPTWVRVAPMARLPVERRSVSAKQERRGMTKETCSQGSRRRSRGRTREDPERQERPR